MSELNTDLIASIEASSKALQDELNRLRGGALRLTEQGDLFKSAVESISNSGEVMGRLGGQLRQLADVIQGLDPTAINQSMEKVREDVLGVAEQLRQMRELSFETVQEQKTAFSQFAQSLEDLKVTTQDLDRRLGTLSARLIEVGGEIGRRFEVLSTQVLGLGEAQRSDVAQIRLELQECGKRIDQQGAAHKQLVSDLDETLRERTEALGAIQGVMVTVLVLVVVTIALVWFKH